MGVIAEDKIVMKKIGEIKPYVRNPRNNEKTIELLCEIVPKVGFNVPLVIDENGIIVKGHARYAAAIRMGMTEVPCIVTHANAEAVKVDRITDNKIAEYSEWVNEEVLEEIESINTDIDFSMMGFPTVKLDDVGGAESPLEDVKSPLDGFKGDLGGIGGENPKMAGKGKLEPLKYYKCVCKDCGHVMFIKARDIEGR